ncbi:MAG TPA: hypothetical protein VJX92_06795, partial [Methylomirabilota bacterium]|nr:hypothetical protein [Methylomirabilota bacterium]
MGSLHELDLAVAAHGRPGLVVVNLRPPLTAWEVGQRLRGLGLESPGTQLGPYRLDGLIGAGAMGESV